MFGDVDSVDGDVAAVGGVGGTAAAVDTLSSDFHPCPARSSRSPTGSRSSSSLQSTTPIEHSLYGVRQL